MNVVISLFDHTGTMVMPWLDAGYECWIIDIRHPAGARRDGRLVRVGADLTHPYLFPRDLYARICFVAAFPPCTDLAVSGARWFRSKGLRRLSHAIAMFATAQEMAEASGAPYMIENPVSTISSYWRKPDHTFHPHQYTGYHAADNYTKKTCLWTGGGFVMPDPQPDLSLPFPDNRIHTMPPSEDRAMMRSATPLGFARAVFESNSNLEVAT